MAEMVAKAGSERRSGEDPAFDAVLRGDAELVGAVPVTFDDPGKERRAARVAAAVQQDQNLSKQLLSALSGDASGRPASESDWDVLAGEDGCEILRRLCEASGVDVALIRTNATAAIERVRSLKAQQAVALQATLFEFDDEYRRSLELAAKLEAGEVEYLEALYSELSCGGRERMFRSGRQAEGGPPSGSDPRPKRYHGPKRNRSSKRYRDPKRYRSQKRYRGPKRCRGRKRNRGP
jgi:hypothetical protein